jgi:hypothetical protein
MAKKEKIEKRVKGLIKKGKRGEKGRTQKERRVTFFTLKLCSN